MRKMNLFSVANRFLNGIGIFFLVISLLAVYGVLDITAYFAPVVIILVSLSLVGQGSIKSIASVGPNIKKSVQSTKVFVHTLSSIVGGAMLLLGILSLPGIAVGIGSGVYLAVLTVGSIVYIVEMFV